MTSAAGLNWRVRSASHFVATYIADRQDVAKDQRLRISKVVSGALIVHEGVKL